MITVHCSYCNHELLRTPKDIRLNKTGVYFCSPKISSCMRQYYQEHPRSKCNRTIKRGHTNSILTRSQTLTLQCVTADWQDVATIKRGYEKVRDTTAPNRYSITSRSTYKSLVFLMSMQLIEEKVEQIGQRRKSFWRLKREGEEVSTEPVVIPTVKTCTKCHETKPLSEFRKDNRTKLGVAARCKTCMQEYFNSRYIRTREIKPSRAALQRTTRGSASATIRNHRKMLVEKGLASRWLPYKPISEVKIG